MQIWEKVFEKKKFKKICQKKKNGHSFNFLQLEKKFFCNLSKSPLVIVFFLLQNDEWFHHYYRQMWHFFLKLSMKLVIVFWNCMTMVTVFWNCTWNWLPKKSRYDRKSCKTLVLHESELNMMFSIYSVFHMKLADKKKSLYGKKSSKSPVSYANRVHFLFYCHTVWAETVEQKLHFRDKFHCQKLNFA